MSKKQLMTFSGPDHPGIVERIMEILTEQNASLDDIGQVITHGQLSLTILLDKQNTDCEKALQLEAQRLGLSLKPQMIVDPASSTLEKQGYVLSCVALKKITPSFLKDISGLFSTNDINIERIDALPLSSFRAMDLKLSSPKGFNFERIKFALMDLSHEHAVDVAFVKDDGFRTTKRLIVFDMDSTLIQAEVIDEMARIYGIGDKVKLITERAMNGEINFDEALRERVKLLTGLERGKMESLFANLPLTPGTEKFMKTVKALGYKTAIVSGGFTYFAENLRKKLDMDYAFANNLEFDGEKLTGQVLGEIINAKKKAQILETLALKEGISLEQVVAVGDGANDLLMLAKAGLGIAFHAKEKVKKEARHQMSHGPMTTILYFLGIPGNHLE